MYNIFAHWDTSTRTFLEECVGFESRLQPGEKSLGNFVPSVSVDGVLFVVVDIHSKVKQDIQITMFRAFFDF